MHIFYVDESYDTDKFVVSALGLKDAKWNLVLDKVKAFRKSLAINEGIYIRRELHAKNFVRDCSDRISRRKLSLHDRRRIFEEVLRFTATLDVGIINVCQVVKTCGSREAAHMRCIERLANRIERTMKAFDSYAVVVLDEGKEKEITRLMRKIRIYNPIPSMYGAWQSGAAQKNIVLERVIDDPFFRSSTGSYFLQTVDFIAWSLLKQEVTPAPFIARWGYDKLFPILKPRLFLRASPGDPFGIVR